MLLVLMLRDKKMFGEVLEINISDDFIKSLLNIIVWPLNTVL